MAQPRHTKQSRPARGIPPQKKQKSRPRSRDASELENESQRPEQPDRFEPGFNRQAISSNRSDYFNEPIEYQGSSYDDSEYPDRSEEPFDHNVTNPNQEFDRYTQGSFFQSRSNSQAIGPHIGKGPKGYQRTDERIQEDVCEMLTHHPSIDAQDIEVEVKNGEVTLSGTVPERRMKYFAEDGAANSFGVNDVINNLRVKKAEEARTASQTPPSTH